MKTKSLLSGLALLAILIPMVLSFPFCKGNLDPGEAPPPQFPPSVTTSAVINITVSSATSGGNVSSEGSSDVTARGVCWATTQNPTTSDSHTSDGFGSGVFTSTLAVLSVNTQFYVRAYATNDQGTSYGNEIVFSTSASGGVPVLNTMPITDITNTSASSGGNIIAEGSSPVLMRGVCWNTSSSPTITDPHTTDGTGNGSYASQITGLSEGTQYYVRAYATNTEGTGYGNAETFTTSGGSGISNNPCPGIPTITDSRDGQIYPTVLIGSQCWLYKNINYATGNSWCYDNEGSNCSTYGRLYDWESALNACPNGWHVPTNDEFGALLAHVGNDPAGKLKETGTTHWDNPNTGATNSSEFTALPGGFWNPGTGNFHSKGARAAFWSMTEDGLSSPLAWYLYLVSYNTTAYNYSNNKTYGFSVRCIQN